MRRDSDREFSAWLDGADTSSLSPADPTVLAIRRAIDLHIATPGIIPSGGIPCDLIRRIVRDLLLDEVEIDLAAAGLPVDGVEPTVVFREAFGVYAKFAAECWERAT